MGKKDDNNHELAILKSAVDNTNEGLVTIDQDHKVYFFNKAAERIFGYGRAEVIGRDLNIIMTPGCSKEHRNSVERYAKTRVPSQIGHDTELIATRKNGKTFVANISFSVTEVDDKLFFTGIVRDITETKNLQKQISRSERLAALGQFIAEISHEIKNPLMMIGGFARQLARHIKNKKAREKLDIILKEVLRLEDLLKQLKEFYMPNPMTVEQIEVISLLDEIHSLAKADCEDKNISTSFKTDKKEIIIERDRNQLKQVLLNLVKNSIEAMDGGGHLAINAEHNGDAVEISIIDNGCGIPEADQDKVFSPFYTTKTHGSGLGLSISKNIIECQDGGSCTLESKEGEGTVFKIRLPVSSE